MQNIYTYKNRKKKGENKQSTPGYLNYHTMGNLREKKEEKKRKTTANPPPKKNTPKSQQKQQQQKTEGKP